jgi:hypothetical protein
MQIIFKPIRHGGSGYALTITLIFLALSLMIFGSMMYWVSSNAQVSLRNNQFNMSEAAAEGAAEKALAQMNRDFLAQSLTNASYYQTLLPSMTNSGNVWPIQYTFSDSNNIVGQISVNLGPPATNTVNLNSQFSGLYGLAQDCTIIATATPIGQPYIVPATISETVQFASIPLFQFAIFYNVNLEIAPGAAMNITGPVFCNQSIWEGSSLTTFSSRVTAVGTNDTLAADPFANNYSKDGGPTFTLAGQPSISNDPLTMPMGTNNDPAVIQALLNLPPTNWPMNTAAAFSTNGQIYLANSADLYITNSFNGINSSSPSGINNTLIYYSDSANLPYPQALIANDFFILRVAAPGGRTITNLVSTNTLAGIDCITNVQYAGYSFVTNVLFYDWREGWNGGSGIGGKGKAVQALQIDIAKLNIWRTNVATNGVLGGNVVSGGNANAANWYNQQCILHKGHPIDSIYVYTAVPLTATTLPAVRVVNGQILQSISYGTVVYGLTVATSFPMYVKGNYNTTDGSGSSLAVNTTDNTYPAALMADSITILSPSWDDSQTGKMPSPSETTINAACLEGIVQTDPTISGDYSGGVENFLRLLENWSGVNLWYNGSIVVMFPSQYAVGHWQNTGNYYNAPTRKWAFDLNFAQQGKLPPLTPQSKAIIRGNWNAY